MSLRIRFLGLITHAAVGGDVAVLYTAPDHRVRLALERRFIDGSDPNDHSIDCRDLTNRVISFRGLSGPVDRTGLIGVPSLNILGGLGKTVSADIARRATGGSFSSFVELANGKYGIEDYYEYRVTYNGTDHICLPQTITFLSPVTTPVDVDGLAAPLKLTPNAVITIINAETATHSGTAPHYVLYGSFFDPPATIFVPTEVTVKCPGGNPQPNVPKCPNEKKHNVGVECSNTQYP